MIIIWYHMLNFLLIRLCQGSWRLWQGFLIPERVNGLMLSYVISTIVLAGSLLSAQWKIKCVSWFSPLMEINCFILVFPDWLLFLLLAGTRSRQETFGETCKETLLWCRVSFSPLKISKLIWFKHKNLRLVFNFVLSLKWCVCLCFSLFAQQLWEKCPTDERWGVGWRETVVRWHLHTHKVKPSAFVELMQLLTCCVK